MRHIPDFFRRIKTLPAETVKGTIKQIAEDIRENRFLSLAVTHAALGFYVIPKAEKSGLHAASADMDSFLDEVVTILEWPELRNLKKFIKYDALRKVLLRHYRLDSDSEDDVRRYHNFLALLLLYIDALSCRSEEFKNSAAYRDYKLFEVESYLDRLFSTDPNEPPTIYQFPKQKIAASGLVDVLKQELGIETPKDNTIGDYFRISDTAAKFICYRRTTRQVQGLRPNKITKSYLAVHRPDSKSEIYTYRHRYKDVDGDDRVTSGFVVRLAKCYYFVGGSKRPEDRPTVGLKILAVPADDVYTRYGHQFISGLFLSNDSALNPICGRMLLVRIAETTDEAAEANYGRIEEDHFVSDLKAISSASTQLKESDDVWLKGAITIAMPEGEMSGGSIMAAALRFPD